MKKTYLVFLLYVTLFLNARAQVLTQHAVEGIKHIADMHFFNDSTGVLVGQQSIVRTTNRGESWRVVYGKGTKDIMLSSVAFFENSLTGFAVGSRWDYGEVALILKSSDGGMHWDSLASGFHDTRYVPQTVICSGVMNVIVIGTAGSVIGSGDAGKSWTRFIDGTAWNYNVDDALVWAGRFFVANGSVFRSDSLTQWLNIGIDTVRKQQIELYALEAVGERLFASGMQKGFRPAICYTTNYGTTWLRALCPTKGCLWDLRFRNEQVGYACGTEENSQAGSIGLIYYTKTAGEIWYQYEPQLDFPPLYGLDLTPSYIYYFGDNFILRQSGS